MALDFSSTPSITVASVQVLNISIGGVVTTPTQPAFHVQSGATTSPGSIIIPANGSVIFNIGNCYNAANGRFTAPVAGVYHFKYHQLLDYGTTGRFDISLVLNGGATYSGTRATLYKDAAGWRSIHTEAIIRLSTSDYINVFYHTGGANLYGDANYGSFSGFMVG
jgi:hypothetical protein